MDPKQPGCDQHDATLERCLARKRPLCRCETCREVELVTRTLRNLEGINGLSSTLPDPSRIVAHARLMEIEHQAHRVENPLLFARGLAIFSGFAAFLFMTVHGWPKLLAWLHRSREIAENMLRTPVFLPVSLLQPTILVTGFVIVLVLLYLVLMDTEVSS